MPPLYFKPDSGADGDPHHQVLASLFARSMCKMTVANENESASDFATEHRECGN
jgi:hypothetical protein